MEDDIFKDNFENLNDEIKQKINQYDNFIYENKINDGKKEILHEILDDLKGKDSLLEYYFQNELFIFGPNSPMTLFYNESIIKEKIPVDDIPWYKWREKQVRRNLLLRAKYCWIIWNLNRTDFKYAKKFIRYSKYIVRIYIHNDWISKKHFLTTHFLINCITSSLDCVHFLKDRKLNEEIIDFSLKLLNFISDTFLIITYQVSEAIIKDLKYNDWKYTTGLESFLVGLYYKYNQDIRYSDITEAILHILIKLFKSDDEKVKGFKLRIAQLYLEKGKLFPGLQSYMSFKDAAQKFQEIGEHGEMKKALKLMEEINPLDHMIKLSFTFDLDLLKEDIEKKSQEFFEQQRSIEHIFDTVEVPTIDSILNSSSDQANITDLFHTIVFSSRSATEITHEQIETGKKKIYDFYQVYINSYLVCKIKFYQALIREGIFSIENLNEYFTKIPLESDLSLFLTDGFKYFISGEFQAALFILIPQLEVIVKKLAEKIGISVLKNVPEGIQEKTLGDFLLDGEFGNNIGKDLNVYLLWFLADKAGLNLRNIVAHGLIRYKDIQPHIIVGLIEIIFTLLKKLVYKD